MAIDRTSPKGRVIGIDIIPAQPPKGVSTLQGNFLSPTVQEELKRFLRDTNRGRLKEERSILLHRNEGSGVSETDHGDEVSSETLAERSVSYFERETRAETDGHASNYDGEGEGEGHKNAEDEAHGRIVDVILSDMSEPWAQTDGFWKRSLSDPYNRMMNTSGNPFRDHVGSMVRSLFGSFQINQPTDCPLDSCFA